MVRDGDNPFSVAVGPLAASGNWLPLAIRTPSERRGMMLVLRLYDTPVSTNAEFLDPSVPAIRRGACFPATR